jgi:hypothetical protein
MFNPYAQENIQYNLIIIIIIIIIIIACNYQCLCKTFDSWYFKNCTDHSFCQFQNTQKNHTQFIGMLAVNS